MQKYCKLKEDIRRKNKPKVQKITKEQRKVLLEQGRKEAKEYFLQKIEGTYGTQGATLI